MMLGWRAVGIAMSTMLPACSLVGLDEVEVPMCEANEECEVLNERDGIAADACERWGCRFGEDLCKLGPRDGDRDGDPHPECGGTDCDDADAQRSGIGMDSCDAIDNDCDLLVDEGLDGGEATELVSGLSAVAIGFGRRDDGSLGVAYTESEDSRDQARFAVVAGTTVALPSTELEYARQVTQTGPETLLEPMLTPGCPPGGFCSVAEVAIGHADPAASRWLFATINDLGCPEGQVRIGYVEESRNEIVLRGPNIRSPIAIGVDVDPDPAAPNCTGYSRGGAPAGAQHISLAALAPAALRALPQGLAAWLGRPTLGAESCPAVPADVEALGVWLETGTVGASVSWVSATSSGIPQAIGRAGGNAPAAIASVESPTRGYLVAYGDEQGDVAMRFVAAMMEDPPELVGTRILNHDATYWSETRDTVALDLRPAFTLDYPGPNDGADEVAIAPGTVRDGLLELGVAWRDGCDASGGAIWFARVRLDPTSGQGEATEPAELAALGRAPAIAYAGRPFVAAGYERDGAVADATSTSGWIVTWIEPGTPTTLVATRVLELDGSPSLDPRVLATGVRSAALYAGTSSAPPSMHYAALDASRQALLGGSVLCALPPPEEP